MKLLLTSGGVTNASIRQALVAMLGRPIEESTALCIPTAMYGHPWVGPGERAWQFISGRAENPMVDLGWKSVGVLGLSAGSMVMTPEVGDDFIQWRPPSGDDSTLGLVDFSICPHLVPDGGQGNTMAEAEEWASKIAGPAYVVDDQTAITVVNGNVEVVSEGHWKQLK